EMIPNRAGKAFVEPARARKHEDALIEQREMRCRHVGIFRAELARQHRAHPLADDVESPADVTELRSACRTELDCGVGDEAAITVCERLAEQAEEKLFEVFERCLRAGMGSKASGDEAVDIIRKR